MARTDIKYDVTLDDMELTGVDYSSGTAVSFAWGEDVTESGISYACGLVTLPSGVTSPTGYLTMTIPYKASAKLMVIKLIADGQAGNPLHVQASLYGETAAAIKACKLMAINPSFKYAILCTSTGAIIASAETADATIRTVDYQNAYLMLKCAPGQMHRYPTTGVGVTEWLSHTGSYGALGDKIISELSADGVTVQSANLNTETGEIQLQVSSNDGNV